MTPTTPPPGPAWDAPDTQRALREWRGERDRDLGRVVAGWIGFLGGVALFVASLVAGWGAWWIVGAVGFAVGLTSLPSSVRGDQQWRGLGAGLAEQLQLQPWVPFPGRLTTTVDVFEFEDEHGGELRTATWTLVDPDGVPVATLATQQDAGDLHDVAGGAALWSCSAEPGQRPFAVFVPHSRRLFPVQDPNEDPAGRAPVSEPEPAPTAARVVVGGTPAVSSRMAARAWRTWWTHRLGGLVLVMAGAGVVGIGVWLLVTAPGDSDGRVAGAIGLWVVGAALVLGGSWFAPRQLVHALRARRTTAAHAWRPFDGQLLRTTWQFASGEGEATRTRYTLFTDDGLVVVLDRRKRSAVLDRVISGDDVLWVSGSLDADPVLLAPGGPALETSRTIRTERQRRAATGEDRPRRSHGYRTDRSPRMPHR